MTSRSARLAAAALALASAGCEPTGEVDGDAAAAPPADDPWAVTETGVGPVRAGMSVGEAGTALGAELAVAGGECSMIEVPGAPADVALMVVRDTVVRVDVTGGEAATAEGARVGDEAARIEELYPDRVRVVPHKYTAGRYLVVPAPGDTLHRLVFETDEAGRVTRFRAGRFPEVEWVEGCG